MKTKQQGCFDGGGISILFANIWKGTGKAVPLQILANSKTIFIAMLRLYGTRGETKIWAQIISACAKKCSRDEGFRR